MTQAQLSAPQSNPPAVTANAAYIACWNEILTPKWLRFRHLLSGNGKVHSDVAYPMLDIRRGDRVLDIASGFGETTLELAERVGPIGTVLGIDCTRAFIDIAERERRVAGVGNASYLLADIDTAELHPHSYDTAVSRFGIMYCASPVRALRAIKRILVPGGQLGFITWRAIADNPCWQLAELAALRHLPSPGDGAKTCGPGPFSMADRETDARIMAAAGFEDVCITAIDAELCVGRSLEEAIDYQLTVGPAGYVIREAGQAGIEALPAIRSELRHVLSEHAGDDGSIWLGSGTWFVTGRSPAA